MFVLRVSLALIVACASTPVGFAQTNFGNQNEFGSFGQPAATSGQAGTGSQPATGGQTGLGGFSPTTLGGGNFGNFDATFGAAQLFAVKMEILNPGTHPEKIGY